jgi:plasmid stability protein
MPVTLSIKTVPDELADTLRDRAKRNHRSLQGELMSILEDASRETPFRARALLERVRSLGVKTHADGVRLVRQARDRQ